ncbi:hypothetical protein TNCV_2081011 [Trichonephila clavipes]|nr:hypothetical protein TNCV_2081011 [Trichonephila clavipes]
MNQEEAQERSYRRINDTGPPSYSGPNTSTRGLLATDHVILNHGQVTWTTPERRELKRPPVAATSRFRKFAADDSRCGWYQKFKYRGKMLRSATRAFDDGPQNFEPWSSDVDDT